MKDNLHQNYLVFHLNQIIHLKYYNFQLIYLHHVQLILKVFASLTSVEFKVGFKNK